MTELNPLLWYSILELDYQPDHFVISKIPITDEAKEWVKTKITGRYSFVPSNFNDDEIVFTKTICVAFEDPKDAVLFELTWG